MTKRRVAITGLGLVTPLALDTAQTWRRILNGESGIERITAFDVDAFSTQIGGEIRDFDVEPYMKPKEARRFDDFIQYGVAAAVQAIQDSGVLDGGFDPDRIGTAFGSGIGGISIIEQSRQILDQSGPRKLSPFIVSGSIINMVAGQLSIQYDLRGPNIAVTTACTTATHNIGLAARMIAYGDADAMVVGGSEAAMTPVGLGGFCAARAMSTRNDAPQQASRPWDKDRDGFVLSNGAGALILEEMEAAKKRGATIYAELSGFGMSADAHHMTAPPKDGNGAYRAMKAALADAGLNPADLDYINAHGTSTPAGDVAESIAIETLMGDAAQSVAVSSTKSMVGHLLGAAGAVEAVFSVLSIRDQVAPPTINLDNPDDECRLNYVPHIAQERPIRHALSNSFGFGGTNGSLLFSAV